MRSLLFVPADSDRKLEKALHAGADAIILDLEDSIAPHDRPSGRARLREFIASAKAQVQRPRLFVRVNGLETGETDLDLDGIMMAGPDGILLPKSRHGADVQHLGAKLAVREAEHGLPDGGTGILAIATETAGAVFNLGTYAGASHRLLGLAWGAEDLSAALGSESSRTPEGHLTGPFRLARDLTLLGARAAQVEPVDTVFVDFRNEAGLRSEAEAARRDGFTCKLAIHPAQVAVINEVFTPSPQALAKAQAVVDAFAAAPQAGTIAIDGQMFDRPHLLRAQRLLARAKA